jgi:hypothetical protein
MDIEQPLSESKELTTESTEHTEERSTFGIDESLHVAGKSSGNYRTFRVFGVFRGQLHTWRSISY